MSSVSNDIFSFLQACGTVELPLPRAQYAMHSNENRVRRTIQAPPQYAYVMPLNRQRLSRKLISFCGVAGQPWRRDLSPALCTA